ncbi:MAG: LamG domain-containing protein, partial [Chloroflexi bacterium]|nr:LamG domain-containing protein [Chloroflexota bacterium]
GQESSTHGSIQWGPYVYDGVDWDPGDIINYLSNDLKTQLDTELLESHITSILGAGESVNNIDNARAGIISLATSYYIGVHQGATSILELGGNLIVDTSSSDVDDYLVDDIALNLGANPAFVGVANETLLLFQELIEEEMFIEVEGDIVGSPISGALEKIVILETFGSVANATDDGSGDFGTSAIEGSQGALQKAASLFEKKILKIDAGSTKWQKRSKNAATAVNLAVGMVSFIGSDAGLTAGEVLAISLSLEFASELMAIYDTAKTVKQGLVGVKVGYLKNLTVAKKAAKSGAILGLIIDTTIIVGVAIYTILSQDIEPGSIAFNTIIAIAIGQLIVAIISAVIAAIFPIGTLVIAIIGLIDFIIMGICAIIEEVEGDGTISKDVDKWVCGGISGAIAAGITEAIYDNYLTVDLNAENRTQMSLNRPTVNVPDGYIPGTSVELSMEVITTLTLAPIEDGLISRSFSNSQLRSKMRRSAFGYYLQRNATDHHDELKFGSVSWSNNQHTFNPSITLNFNNPGVNQSRDIYFTESYNVVTLECWGFIFTSSATCDEEPTRDSFHSKLDSVVFDIFPETFEGFINSGGLKTSYQWIRSGHVSDIDGDGLKTYSRDPNPFSADHDGDGLTDLWEKNNGTDAYYADRDGDGLNDYWEVIYGTNPYHRDSDGDGIWDSDEFPRTQVNNPFNADTQPWTGGWTITYDYDASDNPMETWVWANPLSADSDDDGMSDPTERLYGYNPNVASVLNPVSLVSSIETLSVQAGVVGLNDSIAYTATVGNEDQFNTIGGFLNVEIPENDIQATETINPLLPEEKVTFIGTAPTGHISASTNTSVTVRAEVTLDSLVDNVSGSALLDIPLNGKITTGFIANNGSLGNQATCNTSVNTGGCPLFGDKGQVLEAANFNVRYAREIVYPYTSGLDVNNFSMGLWVKPYNAGGNPKLLIGREEYSLSLMSGSVQFSISGNSGASCGTPTTLLTDSKIDRYQWTHIMATYDGSEMKVYINGEEDLNTATHNSGVCTVENNPFYLGENATYHFQYRGLMDEVLLFGSALNATQVDTLYNHQFFFFDATQRYPIIIDATGPENNLELDTDLPNDPVMLSITSIDDLSVVKDVNVTVTSPSGSVDVLNASQDESGSGLWFFMFTPDIEGQYTVDIDATDAVDNIGSNQTFIYVDDTPSHTTIDSSLTSAVLTTNPDSLAKDNSLLLFGGITDNRTLGSNVTINVQDWLSTTVQSVQTTEIMTTTNSIGTWEVDYLFPARAYGEYPVLAGSEDFVGNQITET